MKYMLDTSAINWIANNNVTLDGLEKFRDQLVTTHVQKDELDRTSNEGRRQKLNHLFEEMRTIKVAAQTWVWDDTPWDNLRWPKGDELYEDILRCVILCDKEKRNKSREKLNQSRDARIIQAAIAGGFVIVTTDPGMLAVASQFGVAAVQPADLFSNP